MTSDKEMIKKKYFIMLDAINTVRENKITSRSANIQIVYPQNRNTSLDIKAIINRFGRNIKLEEKRKQLFTITLNQDEGYKAQRFR